MRLGGRLCVRSGPVPPVPNRMVLVVRVSLGQRVILDIDKPRDSLGQLAVVEPADCPVKIPYHDRLKLDRVVGLRRIARAFIDPS